MTKRKENSENGEGAEVAKRRSVLKEVSLDGFNASK